jgi:ABC-type Fe3+-hydroxamate transport system substrate-binding protein
MEEWLRSRATNRMFVGSIAALMLFGMTQTSPAAARPVVDASAQAPKQAGAARVMTDEVGRRVTIPAEVRRIVSLAPNLTETVYALGLEDRLAGDTDYCDTPAAAKSKPHVGNPQSPSLEAIVALHPDLVLATTSINRVETADALAHLGIPVYTTDASTVRGMLGSIGHMAQAMDAEAQGTALVANLQARLDALQARLADRPLTHVLFVVWEDPLITIGQNTFIADALRWAGAESVVLSKQNWPHVSMEEIVRVQPDYIVLTPNHDIGSDAGANAGSDAAKAGLADLRAKPVWRDLQAVELGHVVVAGDDALRPSPGLVDAIERLAHELHPEVFSVQDEIQDLTHGSGELALQNLPITARCESCAR